MVGAEQQVLHRNVLFDRVRCAVQASQTIAGQMQHSLPESLARDRASVDAGASHYASAFGHCDSLAEFCGLDGCTLARWARANDQHVVRELRHRDSETARLAAAR